MCIRDRHLPDVAKFFQAYRRRPRHSDRKSGFSFGRRFFVFAYHKASAFFDKNGFHTFGGQSKRFAGTPFSRACGNRYFDFVGGRKMNEPKAAVIMGSDSDFETMKACIKTLKKFGIAVEAHVISAHRLSLIHI